MFSMPGTSHRGPLPDPTPAHRALETELRRDLEHLAASIGERNVYRPAALAEAADFLEASLSKAGHAVVRQRYEVDGRPVDNLEVVIAGAGRRAESIVVGAHYDTVLDCPGANDNGTGVVALLALARAFRAAVPERTLRLVCFVNEEPPFFQTEAMGSLVYARRCRSEGLDVRGMLSLETIGYYAREEGTQSYPLPASFLYPTTADFVAFVGNVRSRRLVKDVVRSFRAHAAFPSEGAALPGWITGVGWSDHWSFWKAGYPAVMVTDTAPYRYAPYHTPFDTVDRVAYDGFTRVVDGLRGVVADLVGCTPPPAPEASSPSS
ncbi:MAG: M28 family peptidase [Planctomycetota bacterium]|jgi:hypothetical protein